MATETSLKVRLLNASKTHAEWTSADPVLKKGEIAYSSDKKQIRVGDGSSKWSQLSYIDAGHIVGLSNSGSTITYTKADGSTGTITLPEYKVATSSTPGLVKSGGNITVASDGTVTVNNATKANQVSGTAGSVNADRHVWFSDSATETVRNYDDDFKYNPNTNTLKVTKIDGVELTGTPTAPTATNGTNSTQIATTAFVQNAVGNAEIGGRNLVKDSHKAVSNSSYATADYYFGDDPPLDGEEVTIQIKGKLADTKSYWNLYNSGGSMQCFAVEKERYDATTGIYTDTGTWRVGTAGNTFMRIYAFTSSQSGTSTIEWVKLERGNKPTDWTPAPEDLVSDITLSGSTLSYKNPIGTQLGSYTLSKSTVGLGNVDNTSDVNKPISAATQNALDQLSAKVGNAKQFTGTCSSAADVTAKVVTCTAFTANDLVKGTRISVYFDNTNSGARTSLTLNVNNTGAKPIKYIYNGTYESIPGNNYIKAGQIYNFTYDGTYWVVDMMYNTDADWRVRSDYGSYTAGSVALFPYSLILQTSDGHWESIVTSSTTSANKAKNSHGFLLGSIFYKDGGASVAAGAVDRTWRFASNTVADGRYHFNLENTAEKQLVVGNNLYLVGTIGSDGLFYLDDTWWSQSLPTTDDGKCYIYLGAVYSWYQYNLDVFHPIFRHDGNSVKQISLDSLTVNGHTIEANVPSNAVFTDKYVAQKISTTDNNYPLLLSDQNNTVTTDETIGRALRNNSVYVNPKTGLLTTTALKSNNYLQIKNQGINVASTYSGANVDEIILYTGIKFVSGNLMPKIHITGYAYGFSCPIDLAIVFYIYNNKICSQGVVDNGGWHPNVYLFKYTKDSVDYIAVALRGSTYVYYPTVSADIINEALGKLTNIDLSLFNFQFTAKDADSVIPETDGGTTCIEVPYKTNYNPKPTLTFQMAGTNSAVYNGTETATFNVTKAGIGLGNVENKSSATIRGELTSSNVTTALGYTPVNSNTTAYVYYGGNDQGLGSGTTAEKAKEYFADSSKVPAGMVKFFYNTFGVEFTTIFSKAPGSGYGSALKWGYQDQYLRILRYQANAWRTEDWEKIYAGYADSAGYTTSLRSSIVDINNGGNIDDLLTGSDLTFTRVSHSNIGWGSNDGLILNIPWSTAYGRQIALDDGNNWMATRAKNNTNGWTAWDRIVTKSYGDTIYLTKGESHLHTVGDIDFGTFGKAGGLDPVTSYNIGPSASNKTFGLPAEAITVEYSTDAGATWQDYGLSDYSKKALFAETREQWIYAGKNSTSGQGSTNYWLRVTIYPSDGRYAYINGLYLWVNRAGVTATVDLQRSTRGNPDVFTEVFSGQDIAGWSGNNIRYFSSNSFGGGTDQTSNGYKYRMIFKITSITNANYGTLSVSDIRFLGSSVFSFPSGNYMMKHNRLYNWDADLNATFPAKLIASIIQAPIIQTGTDSTSYFQSQKFRGQGDANTYYHAIDFGYTGHNQVDFYEYGGIYNFWKNTGSGTSSAILLGKITTNGWEGNVVGHASLDLPLTGGQLTGDLTLYASSGNSPAIIFQRGTDSDTLTDWKIIDSSGNLLFQCRDSSATNNAWTTRLTLGYSGTITATTFSGALTGHASLDLPLTAGSSVPLSNSLYITKAGECGVEVNNTQETNPNQVAFIVGSSGNGGIYSRKHNKWIVYANASGDVVLNGNATSATTATTATYLNIVAGDELRFAPKPSSAVTLHVGYKWHDGTSDAKINRYKFCNGNAALAEVEASTFYGSLSGNATTANEAKALITLGDKRSVATTPNDYTNKIVFAGLKAKATVNNPSSDTYSYVIGLRGWNDSSGDKAYEFALNNSGINYRLENTNTTWNSWNAIAHAPNGGVGDAGTPVYMDTDGTLKETQLKLDDIDPICSKTYTGLYGSANDAAGASFYFATIKPNNYYGVWKIKYRIKADVPNQSSYHGYSDVEIYGKTNTYINYLIFNSHFDTSYRTYYYHNLYRATEAGSSAYGHLLGIGLRTSKESTNSSYPRTVTVEVIEAENCTVTMLADPVKYANAPGTGATNYAGLTEFDGYTNGLVGSKNDANDTYTVRDYYTRLTAGTNGMKQYSLVMQDANGTWQSFTTDSGTGTSKTKNTVGFQLGKIYYIYTGSNYASGTTCGDNIVTSHAINLNFQYSSNCGTSLVAYKPLYIKGTYNPSDGLFYLADTWWTQDLPTTEDGFIYKQIGYARTSYNYEFSNTLPTYWYKDGAIREFIVPEATQTVSGLLKSTDKVKLDTLSSTYVSKSGDTMTGSLILESYQDEFMAIDTNIIFKDQSANDDIWCISYSGSSLSIADQTTNHKFEFNNDGEMSVASIQIGSSNAITSIKNLTAKGSLSWVSQTDDKSILINSNTLAYWDGSFNTSHNSNLIYCNKGAFGSIVTKNTGDYIPISGSTSVTGTIRTTGNLETRGASETRIGVGYKTEDTERLFYLWGNNSVGTRGIYDTKKGYVIVTTDTSSHFYGTSDSTSALLSASSITSNSIDDFISVNQLTWAHASSISGIGLSGNDGMVIAMPYSVNSTSYGRQFLIDDDSTKIFTRYRSSNSWKDWDQVLTRSVFDTLGYLPMYSTAIIGEDLDSFMTKNGFQWAKLTNATGLGLSNNDGMVFYVPFGNSYNSGRQFILDDDSNKMFTRYKASGSSWTSSWDQILTKSVADGIYASGDFVSKSGDTMTGELSVSYSNKTTRITNDGIGFGGASGSVIYRNIDDILTIASNSILVCGYENNYVGDPTTVSLTGDLTATGHITGSFGYAMLTIQNKAISATSNSAITGFTSSHYNDTLFSHSGNTITVKKHGVYRMVICWHLSSTSRPASVKNVAWAKSGTTTELGWGAVGRANTYETITSEFLQEISANTTLTLIGRSEGGSSTFRGINAWVELLELL